jgi:hypothetical protein
MAAVLSSDPEQEGSIHQRFREYRERGEWFRVSRPIYDFVREQRQA